MKNILTIGGSTSKNSISRTLAEYAGDLIKNVRVTNIDLNDYELPIFSVDVEQELGFPKRLMELNRNIDLADGFIIALAEHNGSYSAAFKNVFDWLSRVESKVWRNKPMLLLATSTGARGGKSVLEIALARFPYNGGNIIGSLAFPSFNTNFKDGEITDDELKLALVEIVERLEQNL